MPSALIAAQVGTPNSSCAAMAVSMPSATPSVSVAWNKPHRAAEDGVDRRHELLLAVVAEQEGPVHRLQAAVRPDHRRDHGGDAGTPSSA